ncbi:MAG: hypothetical protein LBT89_00250 [Planctomycetaceae bacterium]|jgi:hypothetical protein|nr:hypothetical protein [Planctomycetaceae bacterium]
MLLRAAFIIGFLLSVDVLPAAETSAAPKGEYSAAEQLTAVLRQPTAVFAPQDTVIAELSVQNRNNNGDKKYHLHAALYAGGKPVAELETAITANGQHALPVSFIAPDNDGIYEIIVTARLPLKVPVQILDIRRPFTGQVLTARLSFAVVNPNAPPRPDGDLTLSPVKKDCLTQKETQGGGSNGLRLFNPQEMTLGRLNPSVIFRLPQREGTKSSNANEALRTGDTDQPATLRLPIPIDDIGKPHLIEITYPLHAQPQQTPQQLGAAITELLDGRWETITAEKISIADEIVRDKRLEPSGTHKILFWAKTKNPELVIVNLTQTDMPTLHSVRVAALQPPNNGETLRIPKRFAGTPQRKLFGIISGNPFKGTDSPADEYNAVSQLTDTLCHNGYDGVMLTVLSAGERLSAGVLELLFRQFDRDALTFIPVIAAETPEEQDVLPDKIRELTERYGKHPSFGGVSVYHNGRWSAANVLNTALFYHPSDSGYVSVPADYQNRRRFVKQLTQSDVLTFFDGGERLPTGEQDSLTDLLAAYRRLPPKPFKTFEHNPDENSAETSLQPLTVRSLNTEDGLYVYLVNDAPYQIDADITFAAGVQTRITELSGRRMIRPLNRSVWRATLLPYDLLAVKLDSANAAVQKVSVIRPPEICGEKGTIKEKSDELGQRIYAARNGVLWDQLPNAGFDDIGTDQVPAGRETGCDLAAWNVFGPPTFTAVRETQTVYAGQGSAKLINTGTESGTLLTAAFSPPQTGRLWIAAFVGFPDGTQRIPLNFVLAAEHGGKVHYRHAEVGENLKPYLVKAELKNGIRWQQVIVPFDELPIDKANKVRIGFQVTAPATLWIDAVKLYPVSFFSNEMIELQKVLVAADTRFKQERFSELLTLLESPQCQFLYKNVPLPTLVPKPAVSAAAAPVSENRSTAGNAVDAGTTSDKPSLYQRFKGWFVK